MIVLSKAKLDQQKKQGLIMILVGFIIIIVTLVSGIYENSSTYSTILFSSFLGGGFGSVHTSKNLRKRYEKFFEEKREITISEIAKKSYLPQKNIIFELKFLVANKSDAKKLQDCESVKFLD